MNIIPKKKPLMNLIVEEVKEEVPEEPPVLERQDAQENVVDEISDEEEEPKQLTNEDLFNQQNDIPSNVIPAEKEVVKKKKKLSEKQLKHLAYMRSRAIAKRKERKAIKEAERQAKRDAKEAKRLEREQSLNVVPKKNVVKTNSVEVKARNNQLSDDAEFSKFFSMMERYDRIKNVRKRQQQRQQQQPQVQSVVPKRQTHNNPYLGNMIPF